MSRGPGEIQRRILEVLKEESSDVWTIGKLRWKLFIEKQPEPGDIDGSWNTSFRRAAESLIASNLILEQARKLETFEECVEHYPHKSLILALRKMRCTLLPILLEATKPPNAIFFPKYDECSNEEHHCGALEHSEFQLLAERWKEMESYLRPLFGSGPENQTLLWLMARGAQLFQDAPLQVTLSFRSLVKTLDPKHIPDPTLNRLQAFSQEVLGSTEANSLKLKSYIHTFSYIPRTGRMQLKSEVMRHLWRSAKHVIEKMGDFNESRMIRGAPLNIPIPMNFPRMLEDLMDRSVFGKFKFLTPA